MEDFESILQQQQFDGGSATGVLDHEWVTLFLHVLIQLKIDQPHNDAHHHSELNKHHSFSHRIFSVSLLTVEMYEALSHIKGLMAS